MTSCFSTSTIRENLVHTAEEQRALQHTGSGGHDGSVIEKLAPVVTLGESLDIEASHGYALVKLLLPPLEDGLF